MGASENIIVVHQTAIEKSKIEMESDKKPSIKDSHQHDQQCWGQMNQNINIKNALICLAKGQE